MTINDASIPEGLRIAHFAPEAIQAAKALSERFVRLAESGEEEDITDILRADPQFELARPALGTQLVFLFPSLTYGNEEIAPSIDFDAPVGELCVAIVSPDPNANVDLYHNTLLYWDWDGIGINPMDEYHFEFNDKKQSIRQAIQRLLDAGIFYANATSPLDPEEGCLFAERLAGLPRSPFAPLAAAESGMKGCAP